jgi:hypothetical protein
MWYTPEGMRSLRGPEAELFRLGARALARRIDSYRCGGYFDRLTAGERLVALSVVTRALLEPFEHFPGRTAWAEATIYAVFVLLQRVVASSRRVRLLVEAACTQHCLARAGHADPADVHEEEPELAVEGLADLILWDRDWELEEELCDTEGEETYFVAPPAAAPARVDQAREYLHAIPVAF